MTEDSSTSRDLKVLRIITGYCGSVEDAVITFGGDEEDFLNNPHYQSSCAFYIQQIGENVKRLSSELTCRYTRQNGERSPGSET